MKSFKTYLVELALFHSTNDTFPNNKPPFDAYFGTAEFTREFGRDFGKYTYEIDLPSSANILSLDVDSRTARQFMADCARVTWPGKSGEDYAKLLLDKGDIDDGNGDFYEVWSDKDNILKVLKKYPNFAGVQYHSEYILPKQTIDKLKARKVR